VDRHTAPPLERSYCGRLAALGRCGTGFSPPAPGLTHVAYLVAHLERESARLEIIGLHRDSDAGRVSFAENIATRTGVT
jgi:hypothetical protein